MTVGLVGKTNKRILLENIASPRDVGNVIPISFSWDYIPRIPSFLVNQEWSPSVPVRNSEVESRSFLIYPKAAGFPYHTSLTFARHNRFWKRALKEGSELYELIANDKSYNDAKLSRGGTMASIAQKELSKHELERCVTLAINLFPQSDEERLCLVAAGIILVTVFDDSWEEAPGDDLQRVQDDFVARMRRDSKGHGHKYVPATPLQRRLDEIVARCQACDTSTGTNGGEDFIYRLLEWVMHSQPETEFKTPREYLDYRWMDAANWWLLAACKLSIASSVSLTDPLLERITRLVGDHISIVNDLGSFDKELRALTSGKSVVIINLVQVMRSSCGLDIDDAKAAAFSLQLLNEQAIQIELESLKQNETITADQWRYVDTMISLIAGNVFYTMTTSRYGGEDARIHWQQQRS